MKTIVVTGDPICDHNFYNGERRAADEKNKRGFLYYCTGGGALLLKEIIAETMGEESGWTTEFALNPDYESLPLSYHAFCFWEPQPGGDSDHHVPHWRTIEPPLGYGHPTAQLPAGFATTLRANAYDPNPVAVSDQPDVVVIDDAGIGFRERSRSDLWHFGRNSGGVTGPRWVVLKLTGALGESALWDAIVSQCKDNLVVIVPAEELRRRAVRINRGLSWEATVEDLTAELRGNPLLAPLLNARYLIITFQSDAAFWLDNKPPMKSASSGGERADQQPDARSSLLVFDARRAEGEWSASQGKGGAFGYLSCFTAAVVRELCLGTGAEGPDIEAALGAGLGACRELRRLGHGPVVEGDGEELNIVPGFPFSEIAAAIRHPVEKFVSAWIPHSGYQRGKWMMLDEWQLEAHAKRPHYDVALAVAVLGPEALERFPVAKFGNYLTVERKEVEGLRTIKNLIKSYMKVERQKTPLNLGVFGPPGAGKSFIVLEIAKAVGIKEENVKVFNLSQFSEAAELFGAFHQVRDLILKGTTPLIFWDEFDAQEYRWLQYLLAPMEDGEFQEGQITHPIGKCIFVFAGATSATYEHFGPFNPLRLSMDERRRMEKEEPDQLREVERAWRSFVLAKGPDFKSRLVGFLNLLGMNCRQRCVEEGGRRRWEDDETDLCYPIRRSFFIRANFKCGEGARLDVDPSVLRAMLEIPVYKSAGRSVQVLCKSLRESPSGRPSRSDLPGHSLLDMHVDADLFWRLCEQDMWFIPMAKKLAVYMHEAYRLRITNRPEKKHLDVPLSDLSKDLQEANIAQALRIPGNLRLAKMHLETGQTPVPVSKLHTARHAAEEPIRRFLLDAANIEVLAEAEHNGWMVERMLNGWKYGREPDNEKKHHNCLIPYNQLSEEIKCFDRWTIVGKEAPAGKPHEEQFGYVDIVKTVGLRVVMDEANGKNC